jgi:quercetin dioxygenase-like cupin family protein
MLPNEMIALDEQPVFTDIRMCPGLFVKHTIFAKGTVIPQHSHDLAHLSVIATGAVRVWKDGALIGDVPAPGGLVIEARAKHTFLALADNTTVLCVHRVDEEGEVPIHEEHELECVSRPGV